MRNGGYKQVKASSSTGRNAPMKRDGYAAGSVPPSMVATKPGLTRGKRNNQGYSGPNVAMIDR